MRGWVIPAGLTAALLLAAAPATAQAAPVKLRISDAIVTEGDGGTTLTRFAVRLSRKAPAKITVRYATANRTALGADYTAKRGTLTFKKGQKAKRIAVLILGDTADEPNEAFAVILSRARGARIADKTGVGTILDNDPAAQQVPPGAGAPTPAASVCGNGITEAGEACDDGNTIPGDGCDPACAVESVPVCGNGIVEAEEACDDGNTTPGDGCDAACQSETSGLLTSTRTFRPSALCALWRAALLARVVEQAPHGAAEHV